MHERVNFKVVMSVCEKKVAKNQTFLLCLMKEIINPSLGT